MKKEDQLKQVLVGAGLILWIAGIALMRQGSILGLIAVIGGVLCLKNGLDLGKML